MNISFSSELSYWFVPLCVFVAIVLTAVLYFKNSSNNEWSKLKIFVLVSLRFISVLFVSLLLLNFVIESKENIKNKPLIVIAQDNSESINLVNDSVFNSTLYKKQVALLTQNLSSSFDVLSYDFGSEVSKGNSFSFDSPETNFGQIFDIFNTSLYNRNVKALVLLTDGIINKGGDPINASKNLNVPIYSCALGDTIQPKDVYIDHVYYNKKVYEGNRFPVFVNLMADNAANDTVEIRILHKGKIVHSAKQIIANESYFEKLYFQLSANEVGTQVYEIEVETLAGELNTINNTSKIVLEVSDKKQKILLLQDGFSPDASAFKQVLMHQQAYELQVQNVKEFNDKIEDYALVILNQLPNSKHNISKLYRQILSNKTPMLFIVGNQSQVNALNNLKLGFSIAQKGQLFDDVKASYNQNFALFKIALDNDLIDNFPPLQVPFADYSIHAKSNVLMYQTIGSVITEKPLIYMNNIDKQKVGVIFGEGIWRWRLQDYKENQNHDYTNRLITKLIQYLALSEDKDRLIIDSKLEYDDTRDVRIEAKLFNASYELITTPDITFSLINEAGKEFNSAFNKDVFNYTINLGRLKEGKYSYTAATKIGDEVIEEVGHFVVIKKFKEHLDLKANHNLLFQLANLSGGKVFYPNEFEGLEKELLQSISTTPTQTTIETFEEILNIKWLFLFIGLLIFLEWFLRKFWGGV